MSIPSYNQLSTPIFTPSLRHSSPASSSSVSIPSTIDSVKCAGIKSGGGNDLVDTNSSQINLGKIHNTSEHVQELNQMCLIKDPKEYEKSMMSEFNHN